MLKAIPFILFVLGCTDITPSAVVSVWTPGRRVTGFYVTPHHVMTVTHGSNGGREYRIIEYDEQGEKIYHPALEVYRNTTEDVAILKTELKGEPVEWCEHPAHSGNELKMFVMRDNEPFGLKGRIVFHWNNVYNTTVSTLSGDSGAPMVKDDCVFGMHLGRSQVLTWTHGIMPRLGSAASGVGLGEMI